MIYFCADDYGISNKSNTRIENCFKNGVLNKISVLPNGEISGLNKLMKNGRVKLSLHINLVEGRPLSKINEIPMLVNKEGFFKYSFIGLLLLSISPYRNKLKKQLYTEIKNQIDFWESLVGENAPLLIDSHQHTHAIPLIFKTLLNVIKDSKLNVEYIRIPSEPIIPFILTPTLYLKYKIVGIIKQWLLKFLCIFNKAKLKKQNINYAYFLGVLFSGNVTLNKVKKLLPRYEKMAKKKGKNIEVALHPGYLEEGEPIMDGCRKSFVNFYLSIGRKNEYDTLINF